MATAIASRIETASLLVTVCPDAPGEAAASSRARARPARFWLVIIATGAL